MDTAPATSSRALHALLEPVHVVTYFSPEPLAALKQAGYRGYWMGYFAQRAAPIGAAGPEVVQAAFYNFTAERVGRALPSAWDFAPPSAALEARLAGSRDALRRQLGDLAESPEVAVAADLAGRVAASAPIEGRVLFAGHRSLPEPEDPLGRLWHAATLLREHRGDGHVATLVATGVPGLDSHVLHSLATGSPREVYRQSRDMDDDRWAASLQSLRELGLVGSDGALTDLGRSTKDDVERRTDALAERAYTVLDESERARLHDALLPIARAVVASGDLPLDSPMGMDLRALGQAGSAP